MNESGTRRRERCSGEAGISLVELLVAMGLMVLIVPLAFPMLTSTLTTSTRLEARSAALDDLRIGLGNLTRELRGARCVVQPALSFGSQEAEGDVLQFVTPGTEGDLEVTYDASTGDLVRTTSADTSVVASNLVTGEPVFQYVADPRQRLVIRVSIAMGDDRAPIGLDTTTAPRSAWAAC